MNSFWSRIRPLPASGLSLPLRFAIAALLLFVETLLLSYLIQATPITAATGLALAVRTAQHWVFRFFIAYVASLAILIYVGREHRFSAANAAAQTAPLQLRYALLHALLLVPFAWLSSTLYSVTLTTPFWLLAIAWHLAAIAAAAALFAALAPLYVWAGALRLAGRMVVLAIVPALGAVLAIHWSQMLWQPAARVTFRLVAFILRPLVPDLMVDPVSLTLWTERFGVVVSDVCSGLEGVGLMIVFCVAWLAYFRRDFRFPRALLIVPLAVVVVFLLNAVRIAALLVIGDAGFPKVAAVGFHSQAGWIIFNVVAFSVAWLARRSTWLTGPGEGVPPAAPSAAVPAADNPTAIYLLPLLAILATGMIAHALSAGFDLLYPLRLLGALAVFWVYRARYRALDWSCSWRGLAVGMGVFIGWMALARWSLADATMPSALTELPPAERGGWIACRVLAAVVTVPLAEELAYRGFLARRLAGVQFEAVAYRDLPWFAVLASSVAFGLTHGSMWIAGTLTGLAYGLLVKSSNRLGEAVLAHATTNALIAAQVLLVGQWQLW